MNAQQGEQGKSEQSGVEKNLAEAQEFFNPQLGLEIEPYIEQEKKQGIHHLGRYHWAKQVLASFAPSTVLDIACGTGYGSFILASHLTNAKVVGADYDIRGIEVARQTYWRDNLSYLFANITTWKYTHGESTGPLGNYDAIACFDTIEHLLHREIALIRIVQNLSPDGVLLLSTPCGHSVTRLNPGWEHHKIEYSYGDLQNLLKRFFGTVLLPEDGNLPGMEYWENVVNKEKTRYLNKSNPLVCLHPIQ